MLPTRKNIEEFGPVAGPYSHAVIHGKTLYTSGLTAFGTACQNSCAGDQTDAVLDQLALLAGNCGTDMANLVKVTIYAVDPNDIPGIREVLRRRYGCAVPASSLVLVKSLFAPGLRIEIEAVFALETATQPPA